MPEPSLWDIPFTFLIVTAGVFVAALVIAWLSFFVLTGVSNAMVQRARLRLLGVMLSQLRWPLTLAVVVVGAYLAALYYPGVEAIFPSLVIGLITLLSLLGVYAAVAVLYGATDWYGRELAIAARTGAGYLVVHFLRVVIPVGGILIAVLILLAAAGINAAPVNSWLLEHGGRTALIIVLALAALLVAEHAIPSMISSAMARRIEGIEDEASKRAETLTRTLVTTAQVVAVAVAIFMVIAEVGVNIGPVLAGFGVVGIAIGFGTQSLVRDLVGGFFILTENQYRIGDVVKVGDVSGLVQDLSLRRTVLRDLDGVVHSVPNGEIRINSNYTRGWSRLNMNVAVGYGADPDRVMAVINQVGQALAQDPAWSSLIVMPPKAVGVDYFGDSAFEIKVLGDVKPMGQWDVMREFRRRLTKIFGKEGIELKASQQGLLKQLAMLQGSTVRQANAPRRGRPHGRGPGPKAAE